VSGSTRAREIRGYFAHRAIHAGHIWGASRLTPVSVRSGRAQRPGKPHRHFAEQRRDAMPTPVLQVAFSGAGPATRPLRPMAVDLPGNHRSLNARQNLLRFG
jgi:hypothetical protein